MRLLLEQEGGNLVLGEEFLSQPIQHLLPDYFVREEPSAEHRHRRKATLDLGKMLPLALAPGAEVAL